MHLKNLLQILSYRLLIVLMCGTFASTFVKFVYSADSVNNIECSFIKAEEIVTISKEEILLKNKALVVSFEPKETKLEVVKDVPYPLRTKEELIDTS